MNTNPSSPFSVIRFRDLTLLRLPGQEATMVVACDSFGGIGAKQGDVVRIAEYELGKKIIRVPLMELMAIGATPLLLIDTLGIEMEPGGRKIISGIRDELLRLGLDPDACLNGSTEDNVPTVQTFAGVVAIGAVTESELRSRSIQAGDVALCIGKPKSGPHDRIRLDDPEIVKYEDLRALNESGLVHDMVPVGSHGVLYELEQMAATRHRTFRLHEADLDLRKSAGISTCLVVAAESRNVETIKRIVGTTSVLIGEFA